MPVHSVQLVKSARKEFDLLPAKLQSKIVEALLLLSQNPYSDLLKVKKLKGTSELYRIRIGDHRVVYKIRNEILVVIVIKIGHRSDVYRHL